MVLSLSVSNLFLCMTASDSHGSTHGDAPYKIKQILRHHELETLNQLVWCSPWLLRVPPVSVVPAGGTHYLCTWYVVTILVLRAHSTAAMPNLILVSWPAP